MKNKQSDTASIHMEKQIELPPGKESNMIISALITALFFLQEQFPSSMKIYLHKFVIFSQFSCMVARYLIYLDMNSFLSKL